MVSGKKSHFPGFTNTYAAKPSVGDAYHNITTIAENLSFLEFGASN
jgi:hypothetical protein